MNYLNLVRMNCICEDCYFLVAECMKKKKMGDFFFFFFF